MEEEVDVEENGRVVFLATSTAAGGQDLNRRRISQSTTLQQGSYRCNYRIRHTLGALSRALHGLRSKTVS